MASSASFPASPTAIEKDWSLPDRGFIGVAALILTETSLFLIFVVAYLYLHRQESERALSERRSPDPRHLHHLLALQQHHNRAR